MDLDPFLAWALVPPGMLAGLLVAMVVFLLAVGWGNRRR